MASEIRGLIRAKVNNDSHLKTLRRQVIHLKLEYHSIRFFKRRVCAYDRLSRGSLMVNMYARQNRSTRAPGVRSACHTSVPSFATDLGLSLGLGQLNVCLQRELVLQKKYRSGRSCLTLLHSFSHFQLNFRFPTLRNISTSNDMRRFLYWYAWFLSMVCHGHGFLYIFARNLLLIDCEFLSKIHIFENIIKTEELP